MTVILDPGRVRFPADAEPNPFLRYRTLLHSYHLARRRGMTDVDCVEIVRRLDAAVARVDGRGFTATPFGRQPALSDHLGLTAPGGVWVKDETGNVSGSHKARHLMGLLIYLDVVERLGLARRDGARPLAIASCGNAALAAAVVARAGGRPLDVYIPASADPKVVDRLAALGARLSVCLRQDGVPGDPTYHRLQQAIRGGALPFTCQGPDNGLTIEGGKTIGYEIVSDLIASGRGLDRLFIQVGGGALASSVIQGVADAIRLGAPVAMPRVCAVQTRGGYPLKRAYDRVIARLGPRPSAQAIEDALRYAAAHRSEFMWPWEEEPRSVAHGILDDETYDWLAVVRGMLMSDGFPVVVDDPTLMEANDLAVQTTGVAVDHTGSSGLAGLLHLQRAGEIGRSESVAVLFTGIRR